MNIFSSNILGIIKSITLSIIAIFLFGCQSAPVQTEYRLDPSLEHISVQQRQLGPLMISEVNSSNQLGNNAMQYVRVANTVEYFTKSKWLIAPNKMTQDLLVNAFNKTQAFKDVIAEPSDIPARLRLDVTLNHMGQYFENNQSYVVASLQVRLLNPQTRAIYFTKIYERREPTQALNAPSGVTAYNQLWSALLVEITNDIIYAAR